MTNKKMKELMRMYLKHLRNDSRYLGPRRNVTDSLTASSALCHAGWMCQEVIEFVEEDRMEKANRWVGFIQGIFWCHCVFTIDEMRQHNMPEGKEFKPRA